MGLTGVIAEATFYLKPIETGWIRQNTIVANDLGEAVAALMATNDRSYSVLGSTVWRAAPRLAAR
jgi:hypothetical protein